jgi:prepilin-type N-terminal cleavage/methylation domain-containing protein
MRPEEWVSNHGTATVRGPTGERGFTLIELLAVVAVIGTSDGCTTGPGCTGITGRSERGGELAHAKPRRREEGESSRGGEGKCR